MTLLARNEDLDDKTRSDLQLETLGLGIRMPTKDIFIWSLRTGESRAHRMNSGTGVVIEAKLCYVIPTWVISPIQS